MIEVEVDIEGNPKGPIKGNCLCWLGNLEYVTKDASDPDKKLLTTTTSVRNVSVNSV